MFPKQGIERKYPHLYDLMYKYFGLRFTYEEVEPDNLIQEFCQVHSGTFLKETLNEIDSFLMTAPKEKAYRTWLSELGNNYAF